MFSLSLPKLSENSNHIPYINLDGHFVLTSLLPHALAQHKVTFIHLNPLQNQIHDAI